MTVRYTGAGRPTRLPLDPTLLRPKELMLVKVDRGTYSLVGTTAPVGYIEKY